MEHLQLVPEEGIWDLLHWHLRAWVSFQARVSGEILNLASVGFILTLVGNPNLVVPEITLVSSISSFRKGEGLFTFF